MWKGLGPALIKFNVHCHLEAVAIIKKPLVILKHHIPTQGGKKNLHNHIINTSRHQITIFLEEMKCFMCPAKQELMFHSSNKPMSIKFVMMLGGNNSCVCPALDIQSNIWNSYGCLRQTIPNAIHKVISKMISTPLQDRLGGSKNDLAATYFT